MMENTTEVMGFDYYNPKTGNVKAVVKNIAMWMLDTDYDNRSLSLLRYFSLWHLQMMAGQSWRRTKIRDR